MVLSIGIDDNTNDLPYCFMFPYRVSSRHCFASTNLEDFDECSFMADVPDGLAIFMGRSQAELRILQETGSSKITLHDPDFGLGSYHSFELDDGSTLCNEAEERLNNEQSQSLEIFDTDDEDNDDDTHYEDYEDTDDEHAMIFTNLPFNDTNRHTS
jgi:hypothetical protein